MVDTLPSTHQPDDGPELDQEPNIIEAKFGDGYSQRIGEGLNNIKRKIPLNWTHIPQTFAIELDDFCRDHSAGQAFYWTPNGGSQMKWKVVRYKRKIRGAGWGSFSMEIEQVFDP